MQYDAKGRREIVTDEEGDQVKYEYDENTGRMTATLLGFNADGGLRFEFTYDDFGNMESFKNPRLFNRLKKYDDRGRLDVEFSANCTEAGNPYENKRMYTKYAYYSTGWIRSKTQGLANADGTSLESALRTITYEYDWDTGRLMHKRVLGESRTSYEYYPNGQTKGVQIFKPATSAVPVYWKQFTYDDNTQQLQSVTSPEGKIEYAHTPEGQLRSLRTSAGQNTTYSWDGLGMLASVKSNILSDTADEKNVTYEYHPATGQKLRQVNPNGTESTWHYDARGNVKQILHKNATADLLKLVYTRDNRGLIEAITETRTGEGPALVTWDYDYDAQKRLIRAEMTENNGTPVVYQYDYDGAGNRTHEIIDQATTVFTYNSLDQLIASTPPTGPPKKYTYDEFGNQDKEYDNTTPVAPVLLRQYSWDGESRLIGAVIYNYDGNNHNKTLAFGYDEQGTRIRRQLTDTAASNPDAASTTNYLTDYENPTGYSQTLAELDPAKIDPERQYSWGDDLVTQHGGNGSAGGGTATTSYFHSDHLGSKRLLSNAMLGSAVAGSAFSYTPFGALASGASLLAKYKFTGQYADESIAVQYHRGRWYSPDTSNWSSRDAVFDWPGNFGNAYAYAGQKPTIARDLAGTFTMLEGLTVLTIISDLIQIQINATSEALGNSKVDAIAGSDAVRLVGLASFIVTIIQIVMISFIVSTILVGITTFIKNLLRRPQVAEGFISASRFNSHGLRVSTPTKFVQETAEEVPVVARYSDFRSPRVPGEEAHHLNQTAAFKSKIPTPDGVCIAAKGNPLMDNAGPHYEFHKDMDEFWRPYMKRGDREGQKPSIQEYNDALERALGKMGFSSGQAKALRAMAEDEQRLYDISPTDLVPQVPRRRSTND